MSIDGNFANEIRLWFNAVTSPLLAGFGIWIAFQQYRLKQYTLRKDLFDKRFAIFSAAIELIKVSLQSRYPEIEAVDEFNLKVAGTSFLCCTEITEYLEQLRRRYLRIWEISEKERDNEFSDHTERDKLLTERREHRQWMREQPTKMEAIFKKDLNLTRA